MFKPIVLSLLVVLIFGNNLGLAQPVEITNPPVGSRQTDGLYVLYAALAIRQNDLSVCNSSSSPSDCIKQAKCKFLEKIEILDIYRDESIGVNKKSIAYTLTFRNPAKTLTDKEVNKAHEMIRAKLVKELPVTLR